MSRVYVVVEGQTEESFVNGILAPALWPDQVFVMPILLGPPGHKGGNPKYARLRKDVVKLLKQEPAAYCSTMLDFYALGGDFPGMPLPANLSSIRKALHVEQAVKMDIAAELPDLRTGIRFLPYLQLHEYEGLLFSDPESFAAGIRQPNLTHPFQAIRRGFATPEDIDDSPDAAPSKQVLRAYAGYRKVVDGTLGAKAVGLEAMRRECPHFRAWLEQLQALGAAQRA